MGSSKSKPITPNNPLQELQLREIIRDQKKKQKEKEQRNLRKIQEKNNKKQQKHQQKYQKPNNRAASLQPAPNYDLNQQDYELKIEQSLKEQLDNDLCGFILNQATFTLQFFGNFEREISAAYEYIWKQKENRLNQQFEEHSILMANALDAAVERRVKYKPLHGPEKHQLQPLQPQTMYVVFENIDIARPNEANYDSLSPICKVDMETDFYKTTPCNESDALILKEIKWKGYVRLKLRDTPQDNTTKASTKTTLSDEGIYFASESTISSSSRRRDDVSQSISSGYTSGSEYDYAYITHLNSHHPLTELTMTNINEKAKVDTTILPESCITDYQDFMVVRGEDDDEEEEEEGYEADVEDPSTADEPCSKFQMPQIKYLNSKEFMRYFGDLLRRKLAPKIGLTPADFENGTYRGASVHTQNCEIIPAIHVAHNAQNWPDCAFQFKRRERPVRINPLTRKQFQWPTQDMIKRTETFGFHVIPLGYAPKRKKNPYREIEWKIIFPKAERYLETTLTNTQIKVFMIAKALVKTFVEPYEKDNTLMFTIDHLRMHLFWQCEQNYVTWPEEFLGDVLLRFIRSFMYRLREKSLPDFFIQGRNLFESIPEYSLMRLHDVLQEIVSNPVIHLIIALRNLYLVDDFIPKMDFKKIYNNLVENNYLKLKTLSRNSKSILMMEESPTKEVEEDANMQGLIGYSQQKEKSKGQLRPRTLKLKQNIELQRKLDYEKSRRSLESINVEFVFRRNIKDSEKRKDFNQGVENLRRTNILEIILENLITMGETCIGGTENRSIYLARIYLNQAKRLCKFYSSYGCDMGAIEFISKIETIESQIAILRNTESNIPPPALPIRTSLEPIKSFRTKDLEVKEPPKGNIYVRQVSRAKSESPNMDSAEPRRSIKFLNPFEPKPAFHVKADIHRQDSPKHVKVHEEVYSPRRSIKFSDDAITPTQIFRFDDDEIWQRVETEKANIRSPNIKSNSKVKLAAKSPKFQNKPMPPSSSSDSETGYDEPIESQSNTYANGTGEVTKSILITRRLQSPQMSPKQGQSPLSWTALSSNNDKADVSNPVLIAKMDSPQMSPKKRQSPSLKTFDDVSKTVIATRKIDSPQMSPKQKQKPQARSCIPIKIYENGSKPVLIQKYVDSQQMSPNEKNIPLGRTPPTVHTDENGSIISPSRSIATKRQTSSPKPSPRQTPSAIYRYEIRSSPSTGLSFHESIQKKHQLINGKGTSHNVPLKHDLSPELETINDRLSQIEFKQHTPTTILCFENGVPEVIEDLNNRFPSTTSSASSVKAATTFEAKRALIKQMLQKKTENVIIVNGTKANETSYL